MVSWRAPFPGGRGPHAGGTVPKFSAALPAVSFNLMHAIVFAPTQEIAKLALAGRLRKPLPEYAESLGDAAWAGLQTLPERTRA